MFIIILFFVFLEYQNFYLKTKTTSQKENLINLKFEMESSSLLSFTASLLSFKASSLSKKVFVYAFLNINFFQFFSLTTIVF